MSKKFLKNRKIIIILVIIAALIVAASLFLTREDKPIYNFIIAEKANLVQEISATGRVRAVDDINLSFEKSGRVRKIYVDIGDKVKKGALLINLESADLFAELSQSKASVENAEAKLRQCDAVLESAQAELEELKQGTRPEEILIYESKVKNAHTVYDSALENIIDKLKDSYTKSDDAVRNKIDTVFDNPRTSNPQIIFPIHESQLEIDIEWQRMLAETVLISWKNSLLGIENLENSNNLADQIDIAENNLDKIKSFLGDMALAVNSLKVSADFSATVIDGYRSDVCTARANISAATTNLATTKEKLNTANTALLVAKNELAFKEAGSAPEQIAAQEAKIKQAEANIIAQKAEIKLKQATVLASKAKLHKNSLISPINGVITRQDARVGEIVSANNIIVSVISEGDFEIEADIVEADIAYLRVGNQAKLTLDAYGDGIIFEAKVIKIDPAAILIEGVANYRTTLRFAEIDGRIKAGMTADLDIITAQKNEVVCIPQRAIIYKSGGGKIVRILTENNEMEEKEVQTGIRGDGGKIEILTGVEAGDKIITSIIK
ncbi:MAG: efflux RND transporter periplasmic adaptor subunit [Candidatus Pacebacteria bacterium]|nr:efflux RND transporter periplasmic adaptor subunit [Candidatus Paceibacterota bacterium]